MDDLFSKYLKSNKGVVKPKQPGLGEMNRTTNTVTSRIPKPSVTVPKASNFAPDPTILRYSDVINPLPLADNIHSIGAVGVPEPKDTRQATYVNNNYAGDDYVD